jgi:hypothetical protein
MLRVWSRRLLWLRLAAGALVIGLTAAAPRLLSQAGVTTGVALWSLILLLAFAGWGDAAARRLVPGRDVDWPLRTAWGLAVTLAVGGLLALLGLARRPVLIVWTSAGVALAARAALQGVGSVLQVRPRRPGWHALLAGALGLIAAFVALGAAFEGFPNPSDDWPAYLPFIHKLLQTGTLIEPFSVRRMASYGGQTLLQAFLLIVARDTQVQVLDAGICLVLLVGLIFGLARTARGASRTILLLAACVPLMLPDNRANSAAEISAVAGFVALWRTMAVFDENVLDRGGRWLIGLVAAGVATLRQNELPVVACALLSMLFTGDGAPDWPERRRAFGRVCLAFAVCLAPWALMALRSNHTFLFPFFHGNYDPTHAGISRTATWDEHLKVVFADALHGEPVHTMPLILVAVPAAAVGAGRRAALGLWLGTMVAFGLLAWSLPDTDTYTVARYDLGYSVALVIVAGLAASTGAEELPLSGKRAAALALVVIALALQVHDNHGALLKTLNFSLDRLQGNAKDVNAVTGRPEVERGLQAAVPPGARMLVLIERPYLLDFARNPIELLDQPGAASPAPGIPLLQGSEATASYLLARGTRYFAFTRPDRSGIPLYSRTHWKGMGSGAPVWRDAMAIYLATFDVVDHLAQTRRRLYDDGRLVVVDLMNRETTSSTPTSSPSASAPGG